MSTDQPGDLSRRTLMRTAALTGGLAVFGGPSRAAAGVDTPTAELTRSMFIPLIGSTFTTVSHGTRVSMVLRTVDDLDFVPHLSPRRLAAYREQSFSLRFRARADLTGRIRRLHHPRLGAIRLHLGPVGQSGRHHTLEAVFNRHSGWEERR